MRSKRKHNTEDIPEEDSFLGDDTYDAYSGPDLSDDPMMADDRHKSRKERRKERDEIEERERSERERAALKAEILAELRAELKDGGSPDNQKEAAKADDTVSGQAAGEEALPKKKSRFSRRLMSVLSGNILSDKEVRHIYPYLLLIAFLMLVYIGNVFRMQHLYRKHERLTSQVKELRIRSMTIASIKMDATRQSKIMEEIDKRGLPLKESLTPNKVIPENTK